MMEPESGRQSGFSLPQLKHRGSESLHNCLVEETLSGLTLGGFVEYPQIFTNRLQILGALSGL